jgi:serine/threonine protein kinase
VTHSCSDLEDLIDLLTREQVVQADPFRQYLAKRGGVAGLPADRDAALAELVRDGVLTPFQAQYLAAGETAALRVGKYQLLDRLGSAGSSVYRAKKSSGALIALKLLPADDCVNPATVERFRREAEALARTDHPGIVGIKEFGEDSGRLFLAMEHVDGQSLVERLQKEGPLAPVPAVHIVLEALQALAHLHQAGLVHRDLRPSHLLIDREGRVRIVDLGVARFLDDRAGALTRKFDPGRVLGSLEYQAPEQMIDSHDVDIRADVYALGATFYYLLTGKAPFNNAALLRLAAGVVTHPQPLGQLRPDVPRALAAVIEKMMAARPEERYQTPAEAAVALQGWLREVSPTARKAGWFFSTPASSSSRRASGDPDNWVGVLIIAALAALVALLANVLWTGS